MSIEAIKQELAALDAGGRSQMVAYLVALNDQEDSQLRASLTRKIDDRDPANWLTLDQFDARLAEKVNDETIG